MSGYTCAVPFFSEKAQLHGKHTELPSQTKTLLTIFESSQLAHFLFFTAGITRLYHESLFLQGVSLREHSSSSAGMSKLHSKSCCQETKTSFRTSKATISYTVFRTRTSTHGTALHWIEAGPHISVWLRLTKELCAPTGWYARFAQNAAHLHTVKADTKIGSALLLVSLCLFLS